jgi:dihydroorotate dehydrogenase electron transfer subunit
VEIRIEGEQAPFWRRPFSICRARPGKIELLIKTVGQGTRLLAQKKTGETLDILGPLGRGFSLAEKKPVLLVGGGFGVAPLLFLAETLRRKKRPMEVLLGGKCQDDLLLRKELKLAGAGVACTTEDGSLGTKGLVTKLVRDYLESRTRDWHVVAAGPFPMLKAVAALAREYGVSAEVSLEEMMACGLGVCNGCVIKVAGRFQRVCKDGPVFQAEEVEWNAP